MKQFPKRAGLSFLGGVLIQFVFFVVAAILGSPMLALVLLLPGWVLVYAGRSSDPAWGLPVMVLINAAIYAPAVYLLSYWRPFKKKEILSIRAE
jgi:predicted benzoate:H+ symporter BenE